CTDGRISAVGAGELLARRETVHVRTTLCRRIDHDALRRTAGVVWAPDEGANIARHGYSAGRVDAPGADHRGSLHLDCREGIGRDVIPKAVGYIVRVPP